jgi:hypothetical protein
MQAASFFPFPPVPTSRFFFPFIVVFPEAIPSDIYQIIVCPRDDVFGAFIYIGLISWGMANEIR